MCNQYMEYLNNYFGGKDKEGNEIKPICREERQYALFMYNKILELVQKEQSDYNDNDKILLGNLGLDVNSKILNVYYEVTFMRDFIFKEKINKGKDFNDSLYNYIKDKIQNDCQLKWLTLKDEIEHLMDKDKEKYKYILSDYKLNKDNPFNIKNFGKESIYKTVNYGSSVKGKIKHNIEGISDKLDKSDKEEWHYSVRILMRAMMNSKADIGILYLDKEKKYHLKFIECKYESDESDVRLLPLKKDDSIEKPFVLRQTVIQYFICDFICNKICNKENFIADYPIIVCFENINDKENGRKLPKYFYDLGENKIETKTINISKLVPDYLKEHIFN